MKLPENLFNKEELEAIENAKIKIDFSKNYTEDEISELEIQLKDACLDYGFTEGKPNSNCKIWEKICDDFIEVTDNLL